MAVVACVGAQHVIHRLGTCGDSAAECVAATAIDRRALKYGVNVTHFAIDRQVCAVKTKARGEVIEIRSKRRLPDDANRRERRQQQDRYEQSLHSAQ